MTTFSVPNIYQLSFTCNLFIFVKIANVNRTPSKNREINKEKRYESLLASQFKWTSRIKHHTLSSLFNPIADRCGFSFLYIATMLIMVLNCSDGTQNICPHICIIEVCFVFWKIVLSQSLTKQPYTSECDINKQYTLCIE